MCSLSHLPPQEDSFGRLVVIKKNGTDGSVCPMEEEMLLIGRCVPPLDLWSIFMRAWGVIIVQPVSLPAIHRELCLTSLAETDPLRVVVMS